MTSALKWTQINKINVLACAWSEFFAIASWYILSLKLKYELIKLGKRGDSRYTREYLEYVQNKAYMATRKEYVG